MPNPELYNKWQVISVIDIFGRVVKLPACCIHPFTLRDNNQEVIFYLLNYSPCGPRFETLGLTVHPLCLPDETMRVSKEEYDRLVLLKKDFDNDPTRYLTKLNQTDSVPIPVGDTLPEDELHEIDECLNFAAHDNNQPTFYDRFPGGVFRINAPKGNKQPIYFKIVSCNAPGVDQLPLT